MNIVFNPPVNDENRYVELLVNEVRAHGFQVHPLDTVFSSWAHFKSIKLVHLNWFENIDDSGFFVALRSFIRKLTVLTILKLSGKPLIWTMHNRTSHEKGLAFFSRTITRLLMRWSDRIVIHTHQSEALLAEWGEKIAKKAVYIPHPHFIGVYGPIDDVRQPEPERLHVLFIGMVKPYKNLELLIDVVGSFGDAVQLTIAGKALDSDYQRRLSDRASAFGNVTWRPYFIPDSEMRHLLAGADAVVLPYDLSSSLNSGTVLLAFSYGKTVICPRIGTITDLGDGKAQVFHYGYATEEEHREALTEQLAHALALKQREPAVLEKRGRWMRDHVAKEHDLQRVGDQLNDVYLELIGNT